MFGPPPLPRNLEASVRDLGSARAEVRASSIEDLVRHARADDAVRSRAVPLVSQRLADDDARVRAAAATALADLHASEAVAALLVAVEDDHAHVRQMALNALGEIGDVRALPRLRRAREDRRPEVRYQAIIAFARICDGATGEEGPGDRSLDRSEVDDALFEASNDEDEAVVHIALRVAEERLDAGKAPDARLVARARSLLADDARAATDVVVVAAILLAKASRDERALDVVLRVVRGDKIAGRAVGREDERAAVEVAGEIGLERAVPHLERRAWGLARHVRDTCSFHARIALARLGHPRAREEILGDLRSSGDALAAAVVSAGRARIREAEAEIARLTAAAVDPELTREALALLRSEAS